MTAVVWSKTAIAQLQAIRAYIARFNAAEALAAKLSTAANSLANFPHRGRPVPGTDLRELVSVLPYIIRPEIEGDDVFVLRVRHGSRRPTRP